MRERTVDSYSVCHRPIGLTLPSILFSIRNWLSEIDRVNGYPASSPAWRFCPGRISWSTGSVELPVPWPGLYRSVLLRRGCYPEDRIRKLISAHIINFGIGLPNTFTEPAQSRRLKGIGGE